MKIISEGSRVERSSAYQTCSFALLEMFGETTCRFNPSLFYAFESVIRALFLRSPTVATLLDRFQLRFMSELAQPKTSDAAQTSSHFSAVVESIVVQILQDVGIKRDDMADGSTPVLLDISTRDLRTSFERIIRGEDAAYAGTFGIGELGMDLRPLAWNSLSVGIPLERQSYESANLWGSEFPTEFNMLLSGLNVIFESRTAVDASDQPSHIDFHVEPQSFEPVVTSYGLELLAGTLTVWIAKSARVRMLFDYGDMKLLYIQKLVDVICRHAKTADLGDPVL